MNNNNTPRKLDARLQIILGIVFLLAEVFFILLFIRSDMSPERIILGIIIFYFGLILLTLFGIKIPETVSNVLWFPILILIYVKEYFIAPVFAILFFIIAYFAPVIIVLFINQEVQPIKHLEAWIYFLGVFINVAFAYKSNIVLRWSIRNAEARKIVTKWDKYFAVTYTRIFSYVVLILVYISYNVWAFTNPEHIPLGLNVVKEILVTFVSIDTLFQIIISSKKEKKI